VQNLATFSIWPLRYLSWVCQLQSQKKHVFFPTIRGWFDFIKQFSPHALRPSFLNKFTSIRHYAFAPWAQLIAFSQRIWVRSSLYAVCPTFLKSTLGVISTKYFWQADPVNNYIKRECVCVRERERENKKSYKSIGCPFGKVSPSFSNMHAIFPQPWAGALSLMYTVSPRNKQ
jgi:hypothetical protein